MTTEKYKRAVEIYERLNELNETKRCIEGTEKHRLSYTYKNCSDYSISPSWGMMPIADLLDKHDKMIRQEIDDEIVALNEEIKKL